jgi:hypothetical protein
VIADEAGGSGDENSLHGLLARPGFTVEWLQWLRHPPEVKSGMADAAIRLSQRGDGPTLPL